MNEVFCTIITRSHLHWALALDASLRRHHPDLPMRILVVDADWVEHPALGELPHVSVITLRDVAANGIGRAIRKAYAGRIDELRWCLKPVLLQYLLREFDAVYYGDCDLYFYHDLSPVRRTLEGRGMLVSPHWRSARATIDRRNFDLLYTQGLFNGGFVAATRRGSDALDNWAANCLEVCVKDPSKGQYVDQAHLNLLPVYFEEVAILRHRGCNVSNWNRSECAREMTEDGKVRIAGGYPIVFIHFTKNTVKDILSGTDPLLAGHLEQFRQELLRFAPGYDIVQVVGPVPEGHRMDGAREGLARRLYRGLRRLLGR